MRQGQCLFHVCISCPAPTTCCLTCQGLPRVGWDCGTTGVHKTGPSLSGLSHPCHHSFTILTTYCVSDTVQWPFTIVTLCEQSLIMMVNLLPIEIREREMIESDLCSICQPVFIYNPVLCPECHPKAQ